MRIPGAVYSFEIFVSTKEEIVQGAVLVPYSAWRSGSKTRATQEWRFYCPADATCYVSGRTPSRITDLTTAEILP